MVNFAAGMKKIALVFLAGLPAHPVMASPETADTLASETLEEVVVTGQSARQRVQSLQFGAERLELSKLSTLPVLFGENDIIKSISFLPGVHGEGDGAGGFEVRGGNASQNLILLDGATLYNPAHVMGIFSTFNDDAIGRATLYKGPVPPSYGSATSSVLETSLAPGSMDTYRASATVGILAAKVQADGPIVRDRLSFAVTGRRSYADMFLQMVPEYRSTVMNFYDVTAKLRFRSRSGHILDASFIGARDNMAIKDVMGMYWGNVAGSLNWTAPAGERWRFHTLASATGYDTRMDMQMAGIDQRMREYIKNFSINERIVFTVSGNHSLEFGLRSELLRVKSGEIRVSGNDLREIRSGWLNAVWAAYEGRFGERFGLSGGVRLGVYTSLSGDSFHSFHAVGEEAPDFSSRTYVMPEPRLSLTWNMTRLHSLKAGVSVTGQVIHSIRSSATSFPFDRYALSSAGVEPEKALQYALGYAGMTPSGAFDWSAEAYYRDIDHVYDYRDGRSMFSQVNLESIILGGRGRGYGAEFMFRKNSGPLTGWVSYTLSWTQCRIPGINDGRWYEATNDRRHNVSVVGIYRFNPRWSMSATWTFSSGTPLTAPDLKYVIDGATCYYYSRRNGYRTPDTHRLDLSASYTRQVGKWTHQVSFGVYNAYCRFNPYVVYFEDDSSRPSGTRAVQQSLFGLIPSVSYTLKFSSR